MVDIEILKPLAQKNHEYYKTSLVLSSDLTKEQREMVCTEMKYCIERHFAVCVVYNYDCGCKVQSFFILDRFPMSHKIISGCPECKRGIAEITKPIIFYDPIEKKDIPLSKIKNYMIADTWQKEYLLPYKWISMLKPIDKKTKKTRKTANNNSGNPAP